MMHLLALLLLAFLVNIVSDHAELSTGLLFAREAIQFI